jgi:hypothetical protein
LPATPFADLVLNRGAGAEESGQDSAPADRYPADAPVADRLQRVALVAVSRPHSYLAGGREHAVRLAAPARPVTQPVTTAVRSISIVLLPRHVRCIPVDGRDKRSASQRAGQARSNSFLTPSRIRSRPYSNALTSCCGPSVRCCLPCSCRYGYSSSGIIRSNVPAMSEIWSSVYA